jgi:hypothetical protein
MIDCIGDLAIQLSPLLTLLSTTITTLSITAEYFELLLHTA